MISARAWRSTAAGFLSAIALFTAKAVHADILTIYSDHVIAGRDVFVWGDQQTSWAGDYGVAPLEGLKSFRTNSVNWGGWGVFYDPSSTAVDLSAYSAGELRFWLRSNTPNIKVSLEYATHAKATWDLTPFWNPANANQWVLYRIPLSGVALNNLFSPFQISTEASGTFDVDNVHYMTPTSPVRFDVSVRNRSDNSVAPAITFSGAQAGAGWFVADQYVRVETSPDRTSWGIQIYTDNMAPDANPTFTPATAAGQPGSNPAGLIDTVNRSKRLPMAWSIKGSTITAPSAANPTSETPDSFQWLYMLDRQTPAIALENTTAFTDGHPFATVKNNVGIRYGQAPTEIGPSDTANRIYLEADFRTAVTPRTYRTSTLRIEYFEQ
jgi:hypothetical protein